MSDERIVYRSVYKNVCEWGHCRRGCPPSYLDEDGFCSPACHVGAPRGEFVTLPGELVIKGDSRSA